jgi:hypothetical protein
MTADKKWLAGLKVGDPVIRCRPGRLDGRIQRITKTLFIVVEGLKNASWSAYEAYYRKDGKRWPRNAWIYSQHWIEKP